MNYLKEIIAFHHWLETNQVDSTEQALWFHLMDINNRCGWLEWFAVANMTLQARLGGIDRKTLDRKRNSLKQLGRIKYHNQGKREAGKYKIITFHDYSITGTIPAEKGITGNIPLETGLSVPKVSLEMSTLFKLNKTKQKDNTHIVLDHWNAKKIIIHRELTDKLKGHINAKFENYTLEEICEAIDNYDTVLKGDEYFFSYKWGLGEFLSRENGFVKFTTDSDPLTNYLRNKDSPKQQKSRSEQSLEDWVNNADDKAGD